jgi:hypothetical protein
LDERNYERTKEKTENTKNNTNELTTTKKYQESGAGMRNDVDVGCKKDAIVVRASSTGQTAIRGVDARRKVGVVAAVLRVCRVFW